GNNPLDEDGNITGCTDCSGFTQGVYKSAKKFNIPRTADGQLAAGQEVPFDQLQKGDIVAFNNGKRGRRATHVGIYAGVDEKTGKHMFYEENGTKNDMKLSALEDRGDIAGFRRYTSADDNHIKHQNLSYGKGKPLSYFKTTNAGSIRGGTDAITGERDNQTGRSDIASLAAAHAQANEDSWIGAGQATERNLSSDPDMYRRNAYVAGADAAAQSASIGAQGGAEGAIATKVASAAQMGAAQQAALQGTLTQDGIAAGKSPADAKKFAEEIVSGGAKVSEMFKNGILEAGRAAALIMSSKKQGSAQTEAQKLSNEFGATLTEKQSSISGKTYNQEQQVAKEDQNNAKQKEWEKREEQLDKQQALMDTVSSSKESAAAFSIGETLDNVIDSETSYNKVGRERAKQAKEQLVSDIQNGEEVTTKDIKNSFGVKVGNRIISSLEQNGVVFKDAEGIGTGEAIDAQATGQKAQETMANSIVIAALNKQSDINKEQLASGEISKEEYSDREKAVQRLQGRARGESNGSMFKEDFEDAGFTEESLDKLGIKDGKTDYADLVTSMKKTGHLDIGSILSAASASIDEQREPKPEPEQAKEGQPKTEDTQTEGRSWNDLAQAHANKAVDEFIGAGEGAIRNTENNSDIYAQNALYGEQSKALSTDAKIGAQGGVEEAVKTDTMESTMKAASQKGAVTEQAQQLLESTGVSKEDASSIIEGMTKGGEIAANMIANGITGAAANLAAAQSGAKTAGDLASVGEYKDKEAFIKASERDAIDRTTKSRIMSEIAESPEKLNKIVAEEKAQMAHAEKLEEYLADGQKYGFLDAEGNATKGNDWVRGRAAFSASGMNKNEHGVIGGVRVGTAFNAMTGEAITDINGVRRI
ncbi:MAG: NlpC/P60 family protein, partial [Saccharofermentanales bacterium]